MHYTDTDLRNWDKRRLRISREKRKSLLAQVATLITKLEAAIPAESAFTVERFRRAGSLPKATALHPRGDTGIDADIGVYLNDSDATDYDLATLHTTLRKIVAGVYPTKADSDFWVQPHTLGIQFHASGLKVDLVPLLAIAGETEDAWMVDSNGTRSHKTNIPGHLRFVRAQANADSRYRPLTRMGKSWRNQNELEDEMGSFVIELVLAHLNAVYGPAASLEAGIQRFLLYLAQTKLAEPILSGHTSHSMPTAAVVILDPFNRDNNVAARMTDSDRNLIASTAESSWETLVTAQHNSYKGETCSLWRRSSEAASRSRPRRRLHEQHGHVQQHVLHRRRRQGRRPVRRRLRHARAVDRLRDGRRSHRRRRPRRQAHGPTRLHRARRHRALQRGRQGDSCRAIHALHGRRHVELRPARKQPLAPHGRRQPHRGGLLHRHVERLVRPGQACVSHDGMPPLLGPDLRRHELPGHDRALRPPLWLSEVLDPRAAAEDHQHVADEGLGAADQRAYRAAGRPVIPVDVALGSSGNDAILGGQGLAREALTNASDFFSLADGGSAQARLAQLSMGDGRPDPAELSQCLLHLLADLEPPRAFCVRLLNPAHPDYDAVESYFREVVDPVIEELGYRTLDLGHEPQERAWMNSEIFERLHYAQLAFVDLTAERPNCFIELGYALGRANTTIITAKQGTPTPFDVDKLPWHLWDPGAPRAAERQALRDHISKFGTLPALVEPTRLV